VIVDFAAMAEGPSSPNQPHMSTHYMEDSDRGDSEFFTPPTSPGSQSFLSSSISRVTTPATSICQKSPYQESEYFRNDILTHDGSPRPNNDCKNCSDEASGAAEEYDSKSSVINERNGRTKKQKLFTISSESDITFIIARNKREIRAPPCLQCRIKNLPCDNTMPACHRCIRSGEPNNEDALCLHQRPFIASDSPFLTQWNSGDGTLDDLLEHQVEEKALKGRLMLGHYTLFRFPVDDDERWSKKLELEEKVSFQCNNLEEVRLSVMNS
jgi:hypothetical protein